MSDAVNESELGRGKHSSTPAEHLMHLLNIGWNPASPLIQKYVIEHRLQRELTGWQESMTAELAATGKKRG